MDTIQLSRILNYDEEIRKCSLGVFPADQIKQNRIGCMIINEDNTGKPGSHWVAIFVLPENKCEYFDSYGRNIAKGSIEKFLKKFDILQGNRQVQSTFSTVCGQHCVYYLYNRCRGVPFPEIVASYSKNQQQNDEMVTDFVNSHFGLSETTTDPEFCWRQVSRAIQNL